MLRSQEMQVFLSYTDNLLWKHSKRKSTNITGNIRFHMIMLQIYELAK